jgi:hypothetical protein
MLMSEVGEMNEEGDTMLFVLMTIAIFVMFSVWVISSLLMMALITASVVKSNKADKIKELEYQILNTYKNMNKED